MSSKDYKQELKQEAKRDIIFLLCAAWIMIVFYVNQWSVTDWPLVIFSLLFWYKVYHIFARALFMFWGDQILRVAERKKLWLSGSG